MPNTLMISVDPATKQSVQGRSSQLGVRHLGADGDGRYGTSMFAVSTEVRRELEALHDDYMERIYALTSVASGTEHLMIANVHLFVG